MDFKFDEEGRRRESCKELYFTITCKCYQPNFDFNFKTSIGICNAILIFLR